MTDYEFALELATRAHRGQKDRAGGDYIGHPVAVASMVEGEEAKVVALLHDVAENTDVSLASLRVLFGDRIADAVTLLTHEDGVPYLEYVENIRPDPLATAVKLADLAHNSDLSRLPDPTEEDYERLERYRKARELLERP